ncbi:MAG: DEAD/DEAH box helicase [Verrucomicrobiota bacterium]|nr:DEAD/DEAH box helicase [Verrucomicrobiota bacterium]
MSEDNSPIVEAVEIAPTPQIMFADLGLPESVLRAVAEAGYTSPTPIQAQAIPMLLKGMDLIGGSQTGTGKTAAFALPIIARLGKHGKLRALILEPTRELATQVFEAIEKYAKYTDLHVALFYGGTRYGKQLDMIRGGADIVVATPGRLLDFMQQGVLKLNNVEILVLDEADRMLDMGFLPDVRKIIGMTQAKGRQGLMFSATVPPAIATLAKTFLHEPAEIKIGAGIRPADTISHAIYPVDERQKFDLLREILTRLDYHSVLIFTRTKIGADTVARWLENHKHGPIAVLHADRTQKERESALADFKAGRSEILVATDIVARGIDISDISHVINYDIPQHPEDYVHRIGRTGRAKREGDAMTIYSAAETEFVAAIERFIQQPLRRKKLENFPYLWSPILDDKPPVAKKRNRGFSAKPSFNFR